MTMKREDAIQRLVAAGKVIEPGQKVVIDMFQPQDAEGISHCYYSVYGDAFPVDYVYDPDQVRQHNIGDDHFTVVARTEAGDIVGLGGLYRAAPNRDIYEIGQLMVIKAYRNSSVASRLTKCQFNTLPVEAGAKVVFAEALTSHTITQKLARRHDYIECALQVETMPREAFQHEEGVDNRVSLVTSFMINEDTSHHVYLPDRYKECLLGRYERLGVERIFSFEKKVPDATISSCDLIVTQEAKIARFRVFLAGLDLEQKLEEAEKEAEGCLFQVQLSLGEKSTPWAVDRFLEQGYFYGGLFPLWFGVDALLLQKLPWEPAFSAMKLYSDEARSMFTTVEADWTKSIER